LAKTCADFEDAVIDEDIVDVSENENYHRMERTVHVRGKRGGRPIALTYWDAYRPQLHRVFLRKVELEILEIFVADERVPVEATCRRRGIFDAIGRRLGVGGWRSTAPSLCPLRIDVREGEARPLLDDSGVAEALAELTLRLDVSRLELQQRTGVNLICHFDRSITARWIVDLVDEIGDLLERAARPGVGSPFRR